MASHDDPARIRRRLFAVFFVVVIVPSLALSWLSYQQWDAQEALLQRYFEEEHRKIARTIQKETNETIRKLERDALGEMDLEALATLLRERPDAAHPLLDELAHKHDWIRRAIVVDWRGRLLHPDPTLPYVERRPKPETGNRVDPISGPVLGAEEETGDATLREAIQLFEERMKLEARYRKARDREFAGMDRAGAAVLYEEIANAEAASPGLKALASLARARCLLGLGRTKEARELYTSLAKNAKRMRTENGLPIAPTAMFQAATASLRGGHTREALDLYLSFYERLLSGTFAITEREYRYFRGKVRRRIEELSDKQDDPGSRTRYASLRRRERRLEQLLDFRRMCEELLLPDLVKLLKQGEPSGTWSHFTRMTVQPHVVCYRIVRTETDERPLLIGVHLDLARVSDRVLPPVVAETTQDTRVAVTIRNEEGRVLAGRGPADIPSESRASVTDTFPELFPFWRIEVRHENEGEVQRLGRWRLWTHALMVIFAVTTILAGGGIALRYVLKSIELNRLQQDFVSNVSHELKTPLTSIRMFAEMLKMDRVPSEERKQEYYRIITHESERLSSLIDNILEFARMRDGKKDYEFVTADPTPTIKRTVEVFSTHAKAQGFRLEDEVAASLPPVRHDPDALSGVVMNLLSNARKYSRDERIIEVRTGSTDREVEIEVRDHGIGIDPSESGRIFEKFYRAQNDEAREVAGTGLGLALVRGIVTDHGGEIRVKSEGRGKGASFTVVLPTEESTGRDDTDHHDRREKVERKESR